MSRALRRTMRPFLLRRTSMQWIPGATFRMGSDDFYPEERPVHRVTVDGFRIDEHPVTNAEFARFIAETGYTTLAENPPDAIAYPDADPSLLCPGSLVFRRPPSRVPLHDYRAWWSYEPGASWQSPEGTNSDLAGRESHPVVHVAFADALAYAEWAGKTLPSEAEWELAARGGLDGATFAWGSEFFSGGRPMANTWHGEFPWQNLAGDGYPSTSPVGAFPANGFGLHDMTGNVWEWTADFYIGPHPTDAKKACCIPRNPRVSAPVAGDASSIPRRVIKGGSYLCAPNYCQRYRPAARQGQAVDTSACHLGFRCIRRPT